MLHATRLQMRAAASFLTVIDEKVSCKTKAHSQKLLYLPISVLHYQTGNDNYYSVLTCENSETSIIYSHPTGGEKELQQFFVAQESKREHEFDYTASTITIGTILAGGITHIFFGNIWCTIIVVVACLVFGARKFINLVNKTNIEIREINDSIQDETNKHLENLIEEKKQMLNGFQ